MNKLKTLLLLLTVCLSGCGINTTDKMAASHYYLNPYKNLDSVGRTVLVELANDSDFPHISADVTEAIFHELQKKQLFGLTVVRQSDPEWQRLRLNTNKYTLEQLSAIRKTLKCGAVLKGTVTGFKPFPHMAIGLRIELIDIADGQLLWAIEQIWDTSDKTTKQRIDKYYKHHLLPGSAILEEKLGTVSSLKFIKFVAYETSETLQLKR